MKFTFWTLAIAGIAGAVFLLRRFRDHLAHQADHAAKAKRNRESRAESDRRDIHALPTSLQASLPDAEAPTGEAAPVPRGRRSSVAPQGFDPDLPPR